MSATLAFNMHEEQQKVYDSEARFKVITAGRRSGKTFFAAIMLILEGLKDFSPSGYSMKDSPVWYIAPTYGQGKDAIWKTLKTLARPIAKQIKEKELTIVLPNDREITLKGSDNEESLRGPSLGFVVLDEYADMKPSVFEDIISPALSDMEGGALFIGTPKGKNHFYQIWTYGDSGKDPEWESFHFHTQDNPMIRQKEIDSAKRRMSREAFEREYKASFKTGGGKTFKEEDFRYFKELPPEAAGGTVYITVDPAGFKDVAGMQGMSKAAIARLDETCISVVNVNADGWYVLDMIHGRWGIRETSLQIIRAAQKYSPAALGVEGGALKNAIMPYLEDQMRRKNIFPNVVELRHGGQRKVDRVVWALQGRFQHRRIHFKEASWNEWIAGQLLDFPDPMSHDDGPDSLAYIDQIASTVYSVEDMNDDYDYEPLDIDSGY